MLRKAKGIVFKPMNPEWYDMRSLRVVEDDTEADVVRKEFNKTIAVNRKPYFMRYVYPDVMSDYKKFVGDSEMHALREFRMTLAEIRNLVELSEASDEQIEFIANFDKYLPVTDGGCVVNRICHQIEGMFAKVKDEPSERFDHKLLQSGEANALQCRTLSNIYRSYIADCQRLSADIVKNRTEYDDATQYREALDNFYADKCFDVCGNIEQLCNDLVEVCYTSGKSHQFVWAVCPEQVLTNLANNTGNKIHYPVKDTNGGISYHGERYTMKEINMEETL